MRNKQQNKKSLGFLRFSGENVHENKRIQKQCAGQVKKQIADGRFIKSHTFIPFTSQIPYVQNPKAATKPNSSTPSGGLSREWIINGRTADAKNICPSPRHKSANLSNCESENIKLINTYYGNMRKSELSNSFYVIMRNIIPSCGGTQAKFEWGGFLLMIK